MVLLSLPSGRLLHLWIYSFIFYLISSVSTSNRTVLTNLYHMNYLKRVFLIDDDEDDRHFFDLGVNELQLKIDLECEQDCESALEKLTDERRTLPEVIFLDWNMPGLSGEQCLKAIRKIRRLDNIPVIVFTTSTAEQDKKNALLLGASAFITKPSNLRDLTILLKGIFRKEEQ